MQSLLIILTALIFYTLGRYAGREEEAIKTFRKQITSFKRPRAGVIDYPTPQQSDYAGSEQEKIDQEQTRLLKEQFHV